MRINDLMAISESATGFSGGTYTDELPGMSLDEAVNTLPVVIIESQMSFLENRAAHNEALIEATISAASIGTAPDYAPIVEASFEDIKKKVKAFFAKIMKFLRSIINKLTLQIDKMKMSGHQLYSKYKDDKMLKNKTWKDLTYNGYKIMTKGADEIFPAASQFETSIDSLIHSVFKSGDDFPMPDKLIGEVDKLSAAVDSTEAKDWSDKINKVNNVTKADRALAMAKQLTGESSLSSSSWESDLRTKLYGEKVDIKYGSDGFTLDNLGKLLENPADLSKIKEEYVRVEKAAREYESKISGYIDDVQKKIDAADKSDDKSAAAHSNALGLVNQYFTAYMGIVSDSYAVINKVKSLKYNYQKTRYDQAKGMLGKMLSWKEPKAANNDASEADEINVLLDFAL